MARPLSSHPNQVVSVAVTEELKLRLIRLMRATNARSLNELVRAALYFYEHVTEMDRKLYFRNGNDYLPLTEYLYSELAEERSRHIKAPHPWCRELGTTEKDRK